MVKIRRKKLYEDDNPVVNNVQQINQQQQNQQQQQNTTQDQNQQPTTQDQNQQQQQQDPQQQQIMQKVSDILKKMENTYWILSVNLPEEIQKEIPDFKQGNQQADPIIKLWNDFKTTPDEEHFSNFVNAFKNYGSPADTSANTQQQQVNASFKAAYSFQKNLMENLNIAKRNNYYKKLAKKYFE